MTQPCSDRGGRDLTRAGGGTATAVIDRSPAPHADRNRATGLDTELDGELELDAYDGDADDGHPVDGYADDPYDDAGGYGGGYDDEDDRPGGAAPRSYRPGRGGFDPDAAEVAAQGRYAFRQRVALGLIAVAVLSALAALVVSSTLWWLHLLTDVVLVGYLGFLRRQTRLEEELRVRRAARLSGERRAIAARRERQADHEARMAAVRRESASWHQEDDEDDRYSDDEYDEYDDDEDEAAPRWAAPRTPAPAVPDGMELVGDASDDPAFHRLDGRERVPSYRRAAGE